MKVEVDRGGSGVGMVYSPAPIDWRTFWIPGYVESVKSNKKKSVKVMKNETRGADDPEQKHIRYPIYQDVLSKQIMMDYELLLDYPIPE